MAKAMFDSSFLTDLQQPVNDFESLAEALAGPVQAYQEHFKYPNGALPPSPAEQIEMTLSFLESNPLAGSRLRPDQLGVLLRPEAAGSLERMAALSRRITRYRYGNSVGIFAPLYLSNECKARCTYCSFSFDNKIPRLTLNEEALRTEAQTLADAGIRHVLALTGEDRQATPPDYIARATQILKEYFPSVGLEIYPMEVAEYKSLHTAGAEGLVLYQETYNQAIYKKVHIGGKKRNFAWRIGGIERAGRAGFERLGLGALLGLSHFRPEVFLLIRHAQYILKNYWQAQVSISLPRIRPAVKSFSEEVFISDRNLAQMYFALRIALPDSLLILSTRENENFRNHMAGLGINLMSAGSKTEPGGYTGSGALTQFSIFDERSPRRLAADLQNLGLNPVWKDWDAAIA